MHTHIQTQKDTFALYLEWKSYFSKWNHQQPAIVDEKQAVHGNTVSACAVVFGCSVYRKTKNQQQNENGNNDDWWWSERGWGKVKWKEYQLNK